MKSISLDNAKLLLARGSDLFGFGEVVEVLCGSLAPGLAAPRLDKVPELVLSENDLARAKDLGQSLFLCSDFSIGYQYEIFGGTLGSGKLLYNSVGGKSTPNVSGVFHPWHWRLTTREVIPDSVDKDWVQQLRVLADYVVDQVYAGQEIPSAYRLAVEEFNSFELSLTELLASDWERASLKIVDLSLCRLCLESPEQALWNIVLNHGANKEYFLTRQTTRTNAISDMKGTVTIGNSGPEGVVMMDVMPYTKSSVIGVRFTRPLLLEG